MVFKFQSAERGYNIKIHVAVQGGFCLSSPFCDFASLGADWMAENSLADGILTIDAFDRAGVSGRFAPDFVSEFFTGLVLDIFLVMVPL